VAEPTVVPNLIRNLHDPLAHACYRLDFVRPPNQTDKALFTCWNNYCYNMK
jgi:hypothetical protein